MSFCGNGLPLSEKPFSSSVNVRMPKGMRAASKTVFPSTSSTRNSVSAGLSGVHKSFSATRTEKIFSNVAFAARASASGRAISPSNSNSPFPRERLTRTRRFFPSGFFAFTFTPTRASPLRKSSARVERNTPRKSPARAGTASFASVMRVLSVAIRKTSR